MSKRILLVEDSDINRCLFQDLLEIHGYTVQCLPSGHLFFQTIAAFNPGLILLDLRMPQIDGFTLLQQLRRSAFGTTPVIVISAYGMEREKRRALGLGARQYLTKPVVMDDVIRAIEAEFSYQANDLQLQPLGTAFA